MITALALLLALAPGLAPIDEAGFQRLVAGHKGKVLLVDFWATWCVPCRKEMPELVKLEARLRGKGFVLVTISADEPEQDAVAQKFLAQQGAPPPAYIKRARDDEKFINSVDPAWSGALPALILYDRAGRKAGAFIGETEMAELEAAIRKLL